MEEIREILHEGHAVAQRFTRAGLRDYFMKQLDNDFYSAKALDGAFEEFVYRLGRLAGQRAELLASHGVIFEWKIYAGKATIVDTRYPERVYRKKGTDGTVFTGAEAIILDIIEEIDLNHLMDNYWLVKGVARSIVR